MEVDLKQLPRKLNPTCRRTLEAGLGRCMAAGHYELTVEHWLLQLLEDPGSDLTPLLRHFEISQVIFQKTLQRALDGMRSGNPGWCLRERARENALMSSKPTRRSAKSRFSCPSKAMASSTDATATSAVASACVAGKSFITAAVTMPSVSPSSFFTTVPSCVSPHLQFSEIGSDAHPETRNPE